MNSSCSPNTQNSIDTDWVRRVRAVRVIKKGEEICDTYTTTLYNTLYRRRSLKNAKYFDCCCPRCSDPSEFGSNFSTLSFFDGPGARRGPPGAENGQSPPVVMVFTTRGGS